MTLYGKNEGANCSVKGKKKLLFCNWLVILQQEHIVLGKGGRVLMFKFEEEVGWVDCCRCDEWSSGSLIVQSSMEQHEITLSQGRSLPPRHVVIVIPIITLQRFLHLTVIQYTSKNCPSCWKFFLLMFHPVSTLQDNAKQTT